MNDTIFNFIFIIIFPMLGFFGGCSFNSTYVWTSCSREGLYEHQSHRIIECKSTDLKLQYFLENKDEKN